MFFRFFLGITGCLLLSVQLTFSNGIIPFSSTPGVHVVYRGIWAVFDNPAGLAGENSFSAGAAYHSQFMMKELAEESFAINLPVGKLGNVSGGCQQFGYELYREQRLCLVYSKMFGTVVSAGIRFDYLTNRFGNDYGNASFFTGSAGLIARITSNMRIAMCIFNPQRSGWKDAAERYPVIAQAGMSWNFGGETELALGVVKSDQSELILETGLRYEVSKRFLLHAGISNGNDAYEFGYALKVGKFEIGMASGYHHVLGFSPRFSLQFKN